MLSDKEQIAINALKKCGWEVVRGPHLEDWDEGQSVRVEDEDESVEVRADIAIIKIDI